MTDNIKPGHYRKGEIDLYEAFSQIFPHNEYRAGMQMIAMRYMFRDKIDRVEDLNKAMETLGRLKQKEIEHAKKNTKPLKDTFSGLGKAFGGSNFDEWFRKQKYDENIYLLKGLYERGFNYLSRDRAGVLYVSDGEPYKVDDLGFWDVQIIFDREPIQNDDFPEVKWSDDEPTKIADLLASYENGGENGKMED